MVEETDQEFEQEMLQYVREALQEALQESETRFQRFLMKSFDEINNLIRGSILPQIENFEQKFNLAKADAEEVAENLEHKIELTKEETIMEYLKDRVDTEEVAENLEHKIELIEEETVMEYLEDRVQLPEMKTPAEIVVATNYGYLQVPIHGFVVPALVSVLVEDSARQDELGTNAEQVSIQESEYVVHNCDNSLRQRNMRSSSVQENETIVHNGGDLVVRRKASGDLVKVKVRKKKRKMKFIQQKLTKMARQIIVSTDVVKENEHHIMETDKLMKAVLEQQNSLAHQVPSKDGIGSTLFPEVTTGYFLPEEDDKFLEKVRAAVEEEERQALAAADTDAAKDAIATAEESRKTIDNSEAVSKDESNDDDGIERSKDQKPESLNKSETSDITDKQSGKNRFDRQGFAGVYDSVANLPMEFYHYYHGSNTDMGTLIEVRRTWDAYIRPGGSRIPGHWVQPPLPADEIWASYLVRSKTNDT